MALGKVKNIMSIKPILFNTEMVRTILTNCKTVTRRFVKDKDITNFWDCEKNGTPIAFIEQSTGDRYPATYPCPYQPGDILYVRETWRVRNVYGDFVRAGRTAEIEFKAGGDFSYMRILFTVGRGAPPSICPARRHASSCG